MKHGGPLALFGALAAAWTWPLAAHLGDAVPGNPGDNYSFLWNLWWMRHVLATPGLEYFHTTYLFYPFGTTIANHPHTALPALIAATLLKPLSVIAAQNVLLLAYVFANLAMMYALTWDVLSTTRLPRSDDVAVVRRASVLAALIFGLSPYVAVHLLGHFDLVAAWVLPAFALALRRAVHDRSHAAALVAGIVLAATAYIAYYYVVYELFFMTVYLGAGVVTVTVARARQSRTTRRLGVLCMAGAIAAAAVAAAIGITGGRTFALGAFELAARTPQNALTAMWILAAGWALCRWRPTLRVDAASGRFGRSAAVAWRVAAVFAAGAAPLFWQAARLVSRGEYVTQQYGWRSVPHGVDLLAPLLGHPLHPLMAWFSVPAYAALQQDYVEVIAWLGIVPAVLLIAGRAAPAEAAPARREWWIVAIAFTVFALGPFLMVAGFDTGLKLPEILLRYVPFAANARMPGRAMVGVYMAVALLAAVAVAGAGGRLRSPAIQWLLVVLVAFEFWAAPIRMTTLDRPTVYVALATAPPGAVCEVPFGIGDGLSTGVGSQDRRILYYATIHEHPLAGGYIGRMPADAADRYAHLPIAAQLLQLSDGAGSAYLPAGEPACRYLVVHRATSSAALLAYVATLQAERVATDENRDLYRLR